CGRRRLRAPDAQPRLRSGEPPPVRQTGDRVRLHGGRRDRLRPGRTRRTRLPVTTHPDPVAPGLRARTPACLSARKEPALMIEITVHTTVEEPVYDPDTGDLVDLRTVSDHRD